MLKFMVPKFHFLQLRSFEKYFRTLCFIVLTLGLFQACNPLSSSNTSVKGENFHPGHQGTSASDLSSIPSEFRGGQTHVIYFSVPSKSLSAKLEYSDDGGVNYSLVSNLWVGTNAYTWTVPIAETTQGKVRLAVVNEFGILSFIESSVFKIDSTGPAAPTLSLTTASPTASLSVEGTIGSCADISSIFISESATSPTLSSTGWRACSTTTDGTVIVLSSTNGVKNLYIWGRDSVGNISSSSTTASIVLDTLAPSLTWSLSPTSGAKLKGGGSYNLSWTSSDSGTGLSGLVLHYSQDGTSFDSGTVLNVSDTSLSWSIPNDDVSTAKIKLVASDVTGNSSVVTTPAFTIDSTPPTVAVSTPSVTLRGGSTYSVSFSGSDVLSGLASFKIQYASTGTTFVDLATLSGSATSHSWVVNSDTTSTAKLKVIGVDGAGNTAEEVTSSFAIDSTPPSAPVVTLASGTPTKSTAAGFTVASCTDRAKIYAGTSSTAPAFNAAGWQDCDTASGAITATLSTGDGTKTLYFFAQDSVGNVSVASSGVTVTLDQTAPGAPSIAFSANSSSTLATKLTTSTMTVSSCTDRAKILITESSVTPTSTTTGWQACSTSAAALSHALVSTTEGAKTLKAWAMDASENVSTSFTTLVLTHDKTAPTISSVSVNAGATYATTPFTSVTVSATDNLSSFKVRLAEANGLLNCQDQYADTNWLSYSGATQTYNFQLSTGDGTKKVCVWGKDAADNVSEITPGEGSPGVDMDTITYSVGNPPKVTSISVSNDSAGPRFGTQSYVTGEAVKIAWAVEDQEGLADKAVTLYYTSNNSTWIEITGSYGSTSGNPTSSSGSYSGWTAPSAGYFRIKIVAKDLAGNLSMPVLSDTQNTSPWTVYAGTTDRGVESSGRAAILRNTLGGDAPKSAVDPKTGDIYAVDDGSGLRKLDAKTGIVSSLPGFNGTNNLGDSGTLTSTSSYPVNSETIFAFDKDGFLYVAFASGNYATTSYMYRINVSTLQYTRYLGGGLNNDDGATPLSSFLMSGRARFTFDESNSLYYWTSCTPGSWTFNSSSMIRLMKLTQNPDGTPGSVTKVFGSCSSGSIPSNGPLDPLTVPHPPNAYPQGKVIAYNNGNTILFSPNNGQYLKILNGSLYRSNLVNHSGVYNPYDGKVYAPDSTGTKIQGININTSGANGDTLYVDFAGGGSLGGCNKDGVSKSSFCFSTNAAPLITPQGKVLIVDGNPGGNAKPYRILYVDSNDKIQTYFGSLPFYGDGLDKSLIRGNFQGIHYKRSSAQNLTSFPEGLYFTEGDGLVLGHIHPTSGLTTIVAGSQWPSGSTAVDQDVVSPGTNFGKGQVDLFGLGFDSDGLPWFKNGNRIVRIGADKKINVLQNVSASVNWQAAPDGSNPRLYGAYPYVGTRNITLKGSDGIFHLAGHGPPGIAVNIYAAMTYFDFDSDVVTKIMGDYPGQTAHGSVADQSAGNVLNKSLSGNCAYDNISNFNQGCYTVYREDQDRLYFTEYLNTIRYVHKPLDSSQSSLVTFKTLTGSIRNFIFSLDNKMIFYVKSDGKLYCSDISSGKTWCNNTSLGPPSGMKNISEAPNQLTWKDDSTLLISNGQGEILSYTLSP